MNKYEKFTDDFKDFFVKDGKIPVYLFSFLHQFVMLHQITDEALRMVDLEKGLNFFEKPIRTKIVSLMEEIEKQYKQLSVLFKENNCKKEIDMRFELFRFLGFEDWR